MSNQVKVWKFCKFNSLHEGKTNIYLVHMTNVTIDIQ
jgi:hypothetical protein